MHTSNEAETMKKKSKRTLTPRLRFPEFREQWNEVQLSQLANSISDRVGTMPCIPYTVTSGLGLLSQEEKLGRTIAGNSLQNYIRLQKGDFAYNKSATKAYPEGYIARYLDEVKAAVPNSIFTCFRVASEKVDPAYLDFLFAGNLHGRWLRKFLTIGARAHGSLNVSDDDLMALPVPLPSPSEQQKIADCLSSLDGLIAAEGRKLAALRDHKRGLMQQLFPQPGQTQPRIRFPEFRDKGEWEEKVLSDACLMQAGKFVAASDIREQDEDGLYPCYGGNGLRGFTKSRTHDGVYPLIGRQGALCGNVRLARGEFHATEHAIVATPRKGVHVIWLFYMLDRLNLNRFATGQAQPGLSVDVLEKVNLAVPALEQEQSRIAACLTSLDTRIAVQAAKIEALKQHKRGLMQQLFPAPENENP